jgi:tRNA U34 5-methylaminomethyl-2-thiouridine-forming methyltransferase MnmC
MELEHLASSAGEPYRDPTGTGTAAEILASRQRAQAAALANGSRGSSGAWRRRWGLEG